MTVRLKRLFATRRRRLAAVVMTLVGACFGFAYWAQQPAVGTVVEPKPLPVSASQSSAQIAATKPGDPWKTSYFQTLLPGGFMVLTSQETPDGPIKGLYNVQSQSTHSASIGVTIGELSGPLAELSAIRLRQNQADIYKSDSRSYAPENAIVMSKSSGYETMVAWAHGDRYAVVNANGQLKDRELLEKVLQKLLADWHWL